MKIILPCLALLLVSTVNALAQQPSNFHVKTVHKGKFLCGSSDERSSPVRCVRAIGKFEGKTYTIESVDDAELDWAPITNRGLSRALAVGKEYPATLKGDQTIIIEIPFKGKVEKLAWSILTIEEN
jgi:hypothetical protein